MTTENQADNPTPEEISEACMCGAEAAFNNRYPRNDGNAGIARDDIVLSVALRAQEKADEFRARKADGSTQLNLFAFCYMSACNALAEVMREKSARRMWAKANACSESVFFDKCVSYALEPSESAARQVASELIAIVKAHNEAVDMGALLPEDFLELLRVLCKKRIEKEREAKRAKLLSLREAIGRARLIKQEKIEAKKLARLDSIAQEKNLSREQVVSLLEQIKSARRSADKEKRAEQRACSKGVAKESALYPLSL